MADLTVQQKLIFDSYKKLHPQLSDAEILSALVNLGEIVLSEDQQASLFFNSQSDSYNTDLQLEHTPGNQQESDLQNALNQRLNTVKSDLDSKVKENRFLRSAWHWVKNTIGFGASSKKVEQALENERKKISQIKNPEVFLELTGVEYSEENYEKLINGEIKFKSEQALEAYKQGQDGVVDFAADMISGIAAIFIYSAAVAGAPYSGGASIAVGFAAAAASGAAIKVGLKAGAAALSGKKYTMKNLQYDAVTGGVSGALGPLTGGVGGAVGKNVATRLGIQAVKEGVTSIAANTAKQGIKQGVKTALVNPTGYKYVGGKAAQRVVAFGAEAMTDGALGGALDGGFRAGYENDWNGGAILEGSITGGAGGAVLAPAIGGGMKLTGKAGHGLGSKIKKFFGWGNKGTKQTGEAVAAKELAEGTEDISPKQKPDEITERQAKTLEGGIKDTELEEVAPFAEHLTEEKHIGDIAIPSKESMTIENGDFVDGEFIPDGCTYLRENDPLNKRSRTYKYTSYHGFLVAQNEADLSRQIADILGDKEISKHLRKQIDRMLKENPDIEIPELSELLGYLNHIGHAKNFISYDGLSRIKDFKLFKTNIETYAEFLYKLERIEANYTMYDIQRAKFGDYSFHFSDFLKFIEEIDSENFEINCNAYLHMRGGFKDAVNPKRFLTTVHDKKFLERIQILDDFNFEHTDWSGRGRYDSVEPYYDLDMLSDDKKFAELLERMEYCKKVKKYSEREASIILHRGSDIESFQKFDSSIPENLKFYLYRFYMDISRQSPDNIDKFIEFCNKMPEEYMLTMLHRNESYCAREIFDCFLSGYAHHFKDHLEPEKILKNVELLEVLLPVYTKSSDRAYDWEIREILLHDMYFKDTDKAIEFLRSLDKNSMINLFPDYNLSENLNSIGKFIGGIENIDNAISNAKMFKGLPEDVRNQIIRGSYNDNKFSDIFSIKPDDLKPRIEILEKYSHLFIKEDNYGLAGILSGKSCTDIRIYKMLADLPESSRSIFKYVFYIDGLEKLSDAALEKLTKYLKNDNLNITANFFHNNRSAFIDNLHLWEELSYEELNLLSPKSFFLNQWNLESSDVIRERLSLIPENLRPIFKDIDDSQELASTYSDWFDTSRDSGEKAIAAMQRLGKLSKEDIDNIGPKTIKEFLDTARYSKIDLNIAPHRLEELKQLPKGALELLKENSTQMFKMLTSENSIDIALITERYNLLVKRNLNSQISSREFCTLIIAGEEKYSIVKALLENPKREIKDINSLIINLPSNATVKKYYDFIFKYLINNPQNKTEDIPVQLSHIFRDNYDDRYPVGSEQLLQFEKQVAFSQKVVTDLIKRGGIYGENGENLLSHFLYRIKEFDPERLPIEEAKYKSIMKFIDSEKYKNEDIISLYGYIRVKKFQKQIHITEELLKGEELNFHTISNIIGLLNDANIKLAELLCTDKNLNFPKNKIQFMLELRISSEITPEVIAEKAKKFYNLGLEDSFIKDIFENSESLTFYSDEVLKILQQRRIDDPNTPLRDVIKALVGSTPDKLQDRINTLILLAKFSDKEVAIFKKYGVNLNLKITTLEDLINAKHHILPTTKEDIHAFLKAFANTDATDDVIRNADFEQFGKKGIPLKYSREAFIKRMNELSGSDFSSIIKHSEDAEIPRLKMSEDDIAKSKEKLEYYQTQYADKVKEYDIVIDGQEIKVKRFCGSKTSGSNEGDFAQIGDKLYYIKFPDETKLEQSVQEVMAAELYRAAGIDAPNMTVMFDKEGKILGMASEYIPNVDGAASGKNLFDSFIADAWLADWDAPKHGNSAMRNGTCLKMDVGGSMDFRARGTKKDNFGNIVNELTSLIEQNSDYLNMTKSDVLASIKHVTGVSDEQIWKIIESMPPEYRNYTLGQKMVTRRDFIKKFEQILEQMDETKYDGILDLMNAAKIQTIKEFDAGTNIASLLGYEQTAFGFEGLLNTRDLSQLNLKPNELAIAQKMKKEIEKFTKYNSVADDIPLPNETKNFLNSILKGMPEFAAFFSKPQHSVHDYSLDIHILKVLQDSLKDSDYEKLSDQDKIVLKFSTLLHDIGKKWLGGKDTGHAELSAEYVYSILDRFKLNDDMKDRIISIVSNHHWFKAFCEGTASEETIATLARRPQDWLIYKIMAKADLINVSEKHALRCVKGSTSMSDIWQTFDKNVASIEAQVQKLREKQVVVTSTKWVETPEHINTRGELIEARTFGRKTATIDGVESEFKVLNLNEIGDDEDMFKYGFNYMLKKRDLRFIVHMPGDGSVKWFNVFKTLVRNPLNNSAQSLSMISFDDTSTYCGRRFGFILDVNNANISHAYYANTGSGSSKGLQNFVREMFETGHHRSFVKDQFIDFMKIEKGIEIDDTEYAQIAEYIMKKEFPETQLRSELKIGDKIIRHDDITIGGKTYKIDDIRDAFIFSRDQLIKESKEKAHGWHNEMVGLNAKVKGLIAKVNSFEELPEYFLRFAKENDLPIILIGYK